MLINSFVIKGDLNGKIVVVRFFFVVGYKSYGCVKNGLFYSENAKIINTRLTFTMILFN